MSAVCVLTALSAGAKPVLPSQCEAFRPALFLEKQTVKEQEIENLFSPKGKKDIGTWGQTGKNTRAYWVAYSDRSGNTTYENPGGGAVYGKLDFNEEVRIATIKDDYALVYVEKLSGTVFPKISRSAVCKGWIPMRHLLLWSDCPTNEYGIYNKALIVANIDDIKNKAHIGAYYTNPETLDGKHKLNSDSHFYFVMKKDLDSGLYLLSKEVQVSGNIQKVLFGWVSKGMFAPWSQRTCLEPNWKPEVVDKELRGVNIPIYNEAGTVATRIDMNLREVNLANNPELRYRQDPRMLRYPLLSVDERKDRFEVTAFASADGGSTAVAMDKMVKTESGTENLLDKMNRVNVILVIDGTSGMGEYFKYANEALNRVSEYFAEKNRVVKVGVVIYRDYDNGQYVTEHLSMRPQNDMTVRNFMTNGGRGGFKSDPNDKTDTEALYKGLEVALDCNKMGYKPENSNLMIVIGDCGNDPNDTHGPKEEEIINKMVKNRIQLTSFQVHNQTTAAYIQFRKQMSNIVLQNMNRQYKELGAGRGQWTEITGGCDFKPDPADKSGLYVGGYREAPRGEKMEAARLYELIKSMADRFGKAAGIQADLVGHADEVLEDRDGTYSTIDQSFVRNMLKNSGVDARNLSGYLTAFRGWVDQKSPNKADYWQPVLYISHKEFGELMDKLSKVNDAVNSESSDRRPYLEAMKSLVRSMVPDITESKMNAMNTEEIMERIAGLNVRTEGLRRYSLKDIESEKKVPKQEFDDLTRRFMDRYKTLDKIRTTKYPYSMTRGNVRWYWIPASYLP